MAMADWHLLKLHDVMHNWPGSSTVGGRSHLTDYSLSPLFCMMVLKLSLGLELNDGCCQVVRSPYGLLWKGHIHIVLVTLEEWMAPCPPAVGCIARASPNA